MDAREFLVLKGVGKTRRKLGGKSRHKSCLNLSIIFVVFCVSRLQRCDDDPRGFFLLADQSTHRDEFPTIRAAAAWGFERIRRNELQVQPQQERAVEGGWRRQNPRRPIISECGVISRAFITLETNAPPVSKWNRRVG